MNVGNGMCAECDTTDDDCSDSFDTEGVRNGGTVMNRGGCGRESLFWCGSRVLSMLVSDCGSEVVFRLLEDVDV